MNPEKPSREEIEAKLTALLFGELPDEEARLLRWTISQDAALAQLHDRLKLTVGFVREVAANPAEKTSAQTAPLKLSDERREKLLAHFKTVAPKEFARLVPPMKKRRETSWVVPLAAAAVVMLLAAGIAGLALPNFVKARATSQANATINNLRQIDGAKQEWALENKKSPDDVPTPDDLKPYLLGGKLPPPVMGEKYIIGRVADPVAADVDARQARKSSSGLVGRLPSGISSGQVVRLSVDGNLQVVDDSKSQLALDSPLPLAAPPAALEQRMKSVEAYFQNGDPTVSSTYGLQSPTTIVLPRGGAAGEELAAATPAPSANFNLGLAAGNPSHDQQVYVMTVQNAAPYPAAQVLQKMFPTSSDSPGPAAQTTAQANRARAEIAPENARPFAASTFGNRVAGLGGGGRGGRGGGSGGGGGGGDASQTPALADRAFAPIVAPPAATFQFSDGNISAGELKNQTFSGAVAVNDTGTQAVGGTGSFFRNLAPDSGAVREPNVPLLRDVPVLGNVFQQRSENNSKGSSFDNNGNIVLADDLSTFGNGAMTLNGFNTYNGVITKNGDGFALGEPENLGEELTHTADKLNRTAQVENEFVLPLQSNLPVANNESTQLAYNNSAAQLDRSRFKQDGAVGTSAIGVDPDTHNLIKVSDAVTMDQIRAMTEKLDQTPAAVQSALPVVVTNGASAPSVRMALAPGPIQATNAIVLDVGKFYSGLTKDDANELRMKLSRVDPATGLPASGPVATDAPLPKSPSPAPVPTPEILTRENAFSTFSLNVSDVSFKLAAASLESGQLPDTASIRTEEFINAFDYRDPEPAAGVPVAFVAERARDPFAHNRDLLRFSIKTAAAGREPGRPLNLVLLLDNSGSMERADRVAIIHEALKVLASQLQPQDTLSIVTFARTARLWVDGARGDEADTAVNKVSDLVPEGGTNLEEAMNLAYATARRHYLANGANRVVLLTDGAANLGNVNPEALKQKVESFRKQGIALDCFGIGWEGYNDDLLEQLSSNGDGRYGFINTPEAATTEFAAQLAGALHVAAEDVKVQVEFNPQRVISYRQIGYAKHQLTKEQFRDNTVAAAPLAAREAGNALYTVEVNPQGSGPVATVRVRFRVPGTTDVNEHEWEVPFDGTAPALEKSSPAMRLAATASAFSEWLASSPFAQEVTTDQLLNYLNGVPAIYGADARPKQLETMIREAKSLPGK
jgi:Mg-chelatase subunit ChlD